MADDTSNSSLDEALERISLLERRIKRVAAERHKATARYAKLAISATPFADQTVRTMRQSLDDMPPQVFSTFSQNLANALTGSERHVLQAQLLEHARDLAVKRQLQEGVGVDPAVASLADKIVSKYELMYSNDDQ